MGFSDNNHKEEETSQTSQSLFILIIQGLIHLFHEIELVQHLIPQGTHFLS